MTNLKVEYITSDGIHFSEDQKDIAEKYQYNLNLLNTIGKYKQDLMDIIESVEISEKFKSELVCLLTLCPNE